MVNDYSRVIPHTMPVNFGTLAHRVKQVACYDGGAFVRLESCGGTAASSLDKMFTAFLYLPAKRDSSKS